MLHSLPIFVLLCHSLTSAIHLPATSPREHIISINAQQPMHTTALLAGESNTAPTAYHSALPLGSHPLSGGFDLTVEEEMYNLKQEMKVSNADYVTVRKDLDSLSAELEELRELVVEMVMKVWGNRVADKPPLTALKEYVNKSRNYESFNPEL